MQYWDTSALVKLFVFEADSEWFGSVARVNPVILSSAFARVELSCALFRKESEKGIPTGADSLRPVDGRGEARKIGLAFGA